MFRAQPQQTRNRTYPETRVRNLFVVVKLPGELMFLKGKTHAEACAGAAQFRPRHLCFFLGHILFVYDTSKTRNCGRSPKSLARLVTLASYNTFALVGSGSKHSTRSPLWKWYLIPREFICSWRRVGETGASIGNHTKSLTLSAPGALQRGDSSAKKIWNKCECVVRAAFTGSSYFPTSGFSKPPSPASYTLGAFIFLF